MEVAVEVARVDLRVVATRVHRVDVEDAHAQRIAVEFALDCHHRLFFERINTFATLLRFCYLQPRRDPRAYDGGHIALAKLAEVAAHEERLDLVALFDRATPTCLHRLSEDDYIEGGLFFEYWARVHIATALPAQPERRCRVRFLTAPEGFDDALLPRLVRVLVDVVADPALLFVVKDDGHCRRATLGVRGVTHRFDLGCCEAER